MYVLSENTAEVTSYQQTMPRLNFWRVLAFSSEDPKFPASNLLNEEDCLCGDLEWLCRSTEEEEAWVVLQLEEPSYITHIEVHSNEAASVEVRVS